MVVGVPARPARSIVHVATYGEVLRFAPAGFGGGLRTRSLPAPTIAALSSDVDQWLGQQTLLVTGTGYVNGVSVVRLDGTPYTTTFLSSTQLEATIPGAEVSGSPLRTSGGKAVTVANGVAISGSSTWTVNAWGKLTHLTGRSGLFRASAANCGVTNDLDQITTWTDILGTSNATGQTYGGGSKPLYFAAAHSPQYMHGRASVYVPPGFQTGNGHVGASHNFFLGVFNFYGDLDAGRVFMMNSALGAKLYCPTTGVLAYRVTNGGTSEVSCSPTVGTPCVIVQRTRNTTSPATELRLNLGTASSDVARVLSSGTTFWYLGSDNAGLNGIGHFCSELAFSTGTEVSDVQVGQATREAMVDWGIA